MKAAVLHASRDLRYEEIETPRAGAGEVVIQVKATGICGSDVPRVLGDGAHYFPIVLGHEFSGVIHEVGEGVEGLEPGKRATAAPLIPCGHCADCQRGDYSLCKQYSFVGSREYGSFAEYVKVPAANVVPFEDNVDFRQAAFFEPSTVALHGLRAIGYRGGEDVAVVGGGTIGLFTMQWAKLLGARSVTVLDVSDDRLALAARLGADTIINTAREEVKTEYGYVFETAGQNEAMKTCFRIAANKAGVCFIGTSSRDLVFERDVFEKMNRKEFLLTGSWMSYSAPFPGVEWTMTAEYFSDGRLKFDPSLIFLTFPMSRAWDAFSLYLTPGAVKGKLMLINEEEAVQ